MSEFKAMKLWLSLDDTPENPMHATHWKDEITGGPVPVSVISWPRELQNMGQIQSENSS